MNYYTISQGLRAGLEESMRRPNRHRLPDIPAREITPRSVLLAHGRISRMKDIRAEMAKYRNRPDPVDEPLPEKPSIRKGIINFFSNMFN